MMWIDDDGHICGNDNEGKNDNGNNDGYENEVNNADDDIENINDFHDK